MAQIFVANVYRINDTDLAAAQLIGFNPTNIKIRPVLTDLRAGPSSLRMYGIIQEYQNGLVVDQSQFYVIESVLALQTLANA